MEANPEGGRRSTRLATKRKQEPEHPEEEETTETKKGGRGRGRGGRGRGRGSSTKRQKKETQEGEGGKGEEEQHKRPKRTPRGRKTPAQDVTGSSAQQEISSEGTGKERGEEEEEKPVETSEEEREEGKGGEGGEQQQVQSQQSQQEGAHELSLEDIMGEQEVKAHGVRFLERGHIYFFYRPKVGEHDPHAKSDVQRLFMLLSTKRTPESPHEERTHRLIALPKKEMPSIERRERHFGVVAKVTHHVKDIHSFLQEEHYHTETRGEREVDAMRPVAEGFYTILDHHGQHTHLVYVLEQPKDLGEVQKAFNITKEGSYILSIKNPEQPSAYGSAQTPEYPSDLQGIFRHRRWCPANPPTFLNYEHTGLLLMGVSDDLVQEFGSKGQQIEQAEKKDMAGASEWKLYEELRLSAEEFPPEPLLQGHWA